MNKKAKILSVLLTIAAILVVSLALKTKPVKQFEKKDEARKEKVDMEKLRQNYKEKIKIIFAEYLALSESKDLSVEQLETVKNKLMELIVSPELRDLHIDLLFAIVKSQDFLTSGNESDKADSQKRINRIKENYSWIN